MAAPKRKAGQPVPAALRKKVVNALKAGDGVSKVSKDAGLMWKTVDAIRIQAGIPARKPGVNNHHVDSKTRARILTRLQDPNRPGEEAIALEEGVTRAVVKKIRMDEGIEALPHGGNWKTLDATDRTKERIARDDEVSRLKQEVKKLHREALSDDAIKILLGRMCASPVSPPAWTTTVEKKNGSSRETPVATWCDWHMGEVVSKEETWGINEYNPEIGEKRVRSLVASTIRICRDYHNPSVYPGIVVNLLGDFISGAIHAELAKTDAEEQIPSALRCRDILVWAIDSILEEFKQVYLPCAAGNNARNTQRPEFKRYVYNSFDWLIYQLLARHYEGNRHVVLDIPATNEVYYRVFGQRYLGMHGDMMGVKGGDGIIGALGPIARGEVKVGKQSAAIGRDFDRLLIAHWHQEIALPRIMVANTLKGFDEFAKNALRAPPSTPSQPLWFVHPKRPQTSYWNITVEEPVDAAVSEWVSFEKRKAA
jgi:hypothetical protein